MASRPSQDERQRAQTGIQEILSERKKTEQTPLFFIVRVVVQSWNRTPREIVEPLSMELFKTRLNRLQGNLL